MHQVGISRHVLWWNVRRRVPDVDVVCRRVVSVVANPDGRNVVHFMDGGFVEADLVVGADGVKGVVKRSLFGSSEDPYPPHYELSFVL